jgi:hypothetical protein
MNAVPQGDCAPVSALTALANANGLFRIVVRKKDLIITSGVNVNPTDMEHGLRQVEDVEGALEEVKREHLEGHTLPRVIAIVHAPLPRNPLGKVLRRVLRDQQNTEAGVWRLSSQNRQRQLWFRAMDSPKQAWLHMSRPTPARPLWKWLGQRSLDFCKAADFAADHYRTSNQMSGEYETPA